MAATRKLQGEIDRCLKKVAEGVETFEDIWKKVHNATNSNQKEKYEADLKKEIKKLQRLRDQIKSWIASAEIKDKSALLENRRLIETQMERFKIVERETKTKAYSKEGLGAAQKMDPAQRIKDEARNWLTSSISSLQIQIDQYESEIESLLAGKKKRLDRDKQDRMDELRSKLDRHKFHVTKLETLLRLLDNDGVEAEQVNKIKDDVEYYIDSSQEPDFEENEFIYDDIIGLEEVELSGTGIPSSATTDSNNSNETSGSPISITSCTSPVSSPIPLQQHQIQTFHQQPQLQHPLQQLQTLQQPHVLLHQAGNLNTSVNLNFISETCLDASATCDKRNRSDGILTSNKSNKQPVKPTALRAVTNNRSSALNEATIKNNYHHHQQQSTIVANQQLNSVLIANVAQDQLQQMTSSNLNTAVTEDSLNNSSIQNQSVIQNTSSIAFAAVAKINTCLTTSVGQNSSVADGLSLKTIAQEVLNRASIVNTNLPLQQQSVCGQDNRQHILQKQAVLNEPPHTQQNFTGNSDTLSSIHTQQSSNLTTNSALTVSAINATSGAEVAQNGSPSLYSSSATVNVGGSLPDQTSCVGNNNNVESIPQGSNVNNSNKTQHKNIMSEAHIPPLLGVAPLGPSPLNKDHQLQFQMMEASFYHLPQPIDSEKMTTYFHRTPVQTPPHYPQSPLPIYDTVEFYQRLSTETLFFVFYYMEGSKAQYLAAKALKKQSWRFHTKYMMWFQRHEEPKIINDDYEQGTYIYFDYEKWSQRKKEGFTFEYKYLEDKELN